MVNHSFFRSSSLFSVQSPSLSPRYVADAPGNEAEFSLSLKKYGDTILAQSTIYSCDRMIRGNFLIRRSVVEYIPMDSQ